METTTYSGIFIPNGDDDECVLLSGDYNVKCESNFNVKVDKFGYDLENASLLYNPPIKLYRMLYRTNTTNLDDVINVLRLYSNDQIVDDIILLVQNKRDGGSYETTRVNLQYKNKLICVYGRYIFNDVIFRRMNNDEGEMSEDSENEDEEDDRPTYENAGLLSEDKIILKAPPYDNQCGEYTYGFKIVDVESGVLDAFAVYR
ncbi:MAG: hypothetical protein EHM79_00590 [Geobacter sp.]|nr:MAG: hypothetical protein EHM79_00590 [Geobacter sp.]